MVIEAGGGALPARVPSAVLLRRAAPEDLEAIAALYLRNHRRTYAALLGAAYAEGLSLDGCLAQWSETLARPDSRVWAAYRGGTLLGFASGVPDSALEETWYLESLHVDESARGQGLGTALIRAAAADAAAAGCRRMSVCIVRGNERAGALYRRLGAVHGSYFTDCLHGTVTDSEKLIWETLPLG